MNREIKFRVWCSKRRMMYQYAEVGINGLKFWELIDISQYTVMQFTGLKDENGVEIYEGDIIEYETCSDSDCETETSIVKFEDGGFSPMCEEYGGSSGFLYDKRITDIKTLGNIYENPELLEETKNE